MNATTTSMALAVLSIALSASCTGDVWFNWQKYGSEYSGYINDLNHWSKDPSTSEAANDYFQFGVDGSDYTVTIQNDTTYQTLMRAFFTGWAGYKMTLDARGATWSQPDSTSERGNYPSTRVQFRMRGNSSLGVENSDVFNVQQDSAGLSGGYKFTDALFTLDCSAAPDFLLDFKQGTYNFLDPNGTKLTSQFLNICGTKGINARDTTISFGPDTFFSVYKIQYGNLCTNRIFAMNGASGYVDAGGIVFLSGSTPADGKPYGMSHLLVTNGASLSIGGNVTLNQYYPFRMTVSSGSTLSIPDSKTFCFGSTVSEAGCDGVLTVTNATLSGGAGSTFKPYAKSRFHGATVAVPTFSPYAETVLSNSVVEVMTTFLPYADTLLSGSRVNANTVLAATAATASFDGCRVNIGTMNGCNAQGDASTFVFKDSVVTSANDNVKYDATIIVDGGRYVSTTSCSFNYSGTGASLVLTNGGEYVFSANANINFAQSGTGSSSLFVRGGKFMSNTSSSDFRWGVNGGSGTGRVELASGEIAVDNRSLIVGKGGYGRQMEMLVSGGRYTGKAMLFTSAANSADKVSCLRQTGGEIVLSGGFHAVTNYPGRTLLSLEGGSFTAAQVFGGLGAAASGGAGYAMLEADGGTIVAGTSPAAAGLVRGFDSAVIGDGGLTVDAAYDVLIPQAFADKDGENGELVLAGSAVKTLSGSSTVSKIVAADGRTVFADGQATTSALLVTNGAEVAFASASAGASISGATFGDASSVGVLVATPGVVPVINGTVDVANIKVVLASGFANYTTNAVLSANSFTEGSAAALAKALVVSGLPAGAAASFMIEEVDGRQVLKMALTDTPTLVIRVDEGVSNIASAVTYPISGLLQTIVAEGASLGISGVVGYGAMENIGDGKVTLSNHGNRFAGDIVSSSGTFSVDGLAALSPYDALLGGMFTLAGGTLELADETFPATFPRALRTSAATETDAVVIKTDTDVTVEGATGFALSGAVIKRGAGTLKVTTAANNLPLAAGYGLATKTNVKYPAITDTLAFGADGKPDATYYAAFTEAEGGVELQGTAAGAGFNFPYTTAIGVPCTTGTAAPYMAVSDASATFRWLLLGCGLSADNTFMSSSPWFYATNAALNVDTLALAYKNTNPGIKPKVTLDASSMTLSFLLRANTAKEDCGVETEYSLVNGSVLTAARVGVAQKASFDCDASTIDVNELFCKSASYSSESAYVFADTYALFTFRNGSRFVSNYVEPCRRSVVTAPLTFDFDNSEWSPKPGQNADYVFAFTNAFNLLVKAGVGGLVLAPGEGLTWSVVHPVTGTDGKIVKRGAGTLAFTGNGALAVGGVNEVESGVFAVAATSTVYGVKAHLAAGTALDLLEGTHSGAVVSGAGNVRNGTLADAVLSVAVDGDTETPLLAFDEGLVISDTLTFDLGRTAEDPVETGVSITVCRYTGTPTAAVRYRMSGTGIPGSRGEFTFEDGTVTLKVKPPRGTALTFK